MCLTENGIISESAVAALLFDPANQKSCFQMFLTNRESCMASKTKMRGQMKTQKKNAPYVCQYWRRGRTSGKWNPSWGLLSVYCSQSLSVFSYSCRSADSGTCGTFCVVVPFSCCLLRCFFFKPKRYINQQKTPE